MRLLAWMIGVALAALFAASASAFVGFLLTPDSGWSSDSWIGIVAAFVAAGLAWVGVAGWLQRRWGLATLGSWAAIWGNTWLWSAVLIPIAFAFVTTFLWARYDRRGRAAGRTSADPTRKRAWPGPATAEPTD